jgi:NADH dehydrogenase FAD-containing subunit
LDQITLHDGRQIAFDFLVIASGSAYTAPIKVSVENNRKDVAGLFPQLRSDSNVIAIEDRQKEIIE